MNPPARRVLLIATRQIGDVLLVTPLLRSLRRAWPEARIDVLVYAGKGGMLENNPDLDGVLEIAEHPGLGEYLALFRRIARRYDLAVSTLSGDRPLFYSLLAAPRRAAVVPPRRWQDAWKRRLAGTYVELDNAATHTVIQNLRLADALGVPRCYEVVPPRVRDTRRLEELLPFPRATAYAVLHLLPMWRYKRWTPDGWRELAEYLITRKHLRVVLTGGKGEEERAYLQEVSARLPAGAVNLAGLLSFAEVAALLAQARLYVGPDTAVTHLAAAVGTPTLALYGPTNPLKWSPWPRGHAQDRNPFQHKHPLQSAGNVVLLQGEGACVPCHEEGCERHKQSDSRCLQELSAARVIAAVDQLLGARAAPA